MDTREPRQHDEWLDAETAGQERLAEQAFASLMATLPDEEPPAAFVTALAEGAWTRRARRRRNARVARVVALVLVVTAAAVGVYGLGLLLAEATGRVLVMAAHGLVWTAGTVGTGLRWWEIAGRIGVALGDHVTAPGTTALLVGAELVAAMAIYAFQRALRGGQPDSQKVGI